MTARSKDAPPIPAGFMSMYGHLSAQLVEADWEGAYGAVWRVAIAAERERCARLLEKKVAEHDAMKAALVRFGRMDLGQPTPNTDFVDQALRECAAAIRSEP